MSEPSQSVLVRVYSRSKRGPMATSGRSVAPSMHVSADRLKSLCGLAVAVVDERQAPSIHNVGCTRCFTLSGIR